MRLSHLLLLAAACTAFVLPDQEVFSSLAIEDRKDSFGSVLDSLPSSHDLWQAAEQNVDKVFKCAKVTWDEAVKSAEDVAGNIRDDFEEAFAGESWLQSAKSEEYELDLFVRPPHHEPPHHGPHHPHHGKPNRTVYELINESKYSTKLAELINEDEELVKLLNSTTANFTVFAPIDSAFEKIPEHHKKPSKEFIKKLLTYHVSTDFYPAGRVLVSRTIPTALSSEELGDEPQRLSTQISFRGLTVNFYARIIAIDIFGTNGVIHGIDSILIPPPKAADIISFLPTEFSTLELGLVKTGLFDAINDTSTHVGGTIFAPSNFAFRRLGPRINGFLFSKYGEKYLKALLKYHVVANFTLYSDAFYKASDNEADKQDCDHHHHDGCHGIPKGIYHVDLPTLLDNRSLSIDIARYGRFITIKVNAFTRVVVPDGIAADGVIHVVPNVLIPPKTPGGIGGFAEEGIELEEFRARLDPFVEDDGVEDEL